MGVQKTYSYATSKGVAGGIYDMFHYPVDSRFNEEATGKLHFGVGVVTGKVPGSSVALPTSASTADNFEGVVINGFDRQQDLEGKLYVLNNQNVGVMRRGRVWVRLATGAAPAYGDALHMILEGDEAGCFAKQRRAASQFPVVSSVRLAMALRRWSCTAFLPRAALTVTLHPPMMQSLLSERRRTKSDEH